jgi:Mn-dependent DtxR family transcriptional regulator
VIGLSNDSSVVIFGKDTINAQILKAIAEISEVSRSGATRPKQIAERLDTDTNQIRVRLTEFKDMGLVENVFYGHWKLTKDGRKSLLVLIQ